MMRSTRGLAAIGAAVLMGTLAACGSSGSSGGAAPVSSTGGATPAGGGPTLSIVKTSLGSVVAGPDGRTVYMFGKDTKGSGKSSCTGPCLANWPPVIVTGTPKVVGISGTVGTITTAKGTKQVTLGGWPLYYYAGDSSAGDVNGQGNDGFGGVWLALTAKGTKVTASPSSSAGAGGYSNKGGGYGSY